jgi:hypothetical protein
MRPMPDSPRLTPAKRRERAAREARLAEALRANLRRRKQQARGRAAVPDVEERDRQDTQAEPSVRRPGTIDPAG